MSTVVIILTAATDDHKFHLSMLAKIKFLNRQIIINMHFNIICLKTVLYYFQNGRFDLLRSEYEDKVLMNEYIKK